MNNQPSLPANSIPFLNSLPVSADLGLQPLREAIGGSTDLPFQHTLVGSGSQRHDPWALAQFGLAQDSRFSPLVAVNPAWEHPVACARRVLFLQMLYGPRTALNIIPGAYFTEMSALGDGLSQNQRLRRAQEFCLVLGELLRTGEWQPRPLDFYPFEKISLGLKPLPQLPPVYLSGAGATPLLGSSGWQPRFVRNLRPLELMEPATSSHGLRVGICARPTRAEAETAAGKVFPESRERQMLVAATLLREETDWSQLVRARLLAAQDPNFFLAPLLNGWVSAPYLVGSYEEIATRLQAYLDLGYGFFLLDEYRSPEEGLHFGRLLAALKQLKQ